MVSVSGRRASPAGAGPVRRCGAWIACARVFWTWRLATFSTEACPIACCCARRPAAPAAAAASHFAFFGVESTRVWARRRGAGAVPTEGAVPAINAPRG